MSRESMAEKVARLLTAGAVRVVEAGSGYATVRVQGDNAVYTVQRRRGGWWCDCRNPGRCSHLAAAQLVTDPRLTGQAGQVTP